MRVVIGGTRGSGKTTFAVSLFMMLKTMGESVSLYEIDVYSDTHRPLLGLILWEERRKKKHAWFKNTIEPRIKQFETDTSELVIGDLPGKITNPFLGEMVRSADSAIIVSRDEEGIIQWESFFQKKKIPVLKKFFSVLDFDSLVSTNGYQKLYSLNRSLKLDDPVIHNFALSLCKNKGGRQLNLPLYAR